MRRTISDKALQHQKKEEHVVKHKTQYELFKEEYDKKLKQKFSTVEERVICLFAFTNTISFIIN